MGTKCPSATFLPEAIFNYVLTVEEYVFALSEGKMPEKCERARKSARNYTNDFFFHSCVLIFRFSFMPCREKTCVKEQKHTLQKYRIRSNTNISAREKRVTSLSGHLSKVFSCGWAKDSKHLVSASQDGKLMVWDAHSTHKVHAIPMKSAWVMSCCFSQKTPRFVASGGKAT